MTRGTNVVTGHIQKAVGAQRGLLTQGLEAHSGETLQSNSEWDRGGGG